MVTKNSVVVVAAGKGSRMSGRIKKQFLELGGKPVLDYSLEFFDRCAILDDIVLVVAKDDMDYCRKLASKYNKVSKVVIGGNTRQDSVFNGLGYVEKDTDVVLVHDAARPFVNFLDLEKLIYAAKCYGSSTFGVLVKDTIKIKNDDMEIIETLNRDELVAIQTPQAFLYNKILDAHNEAKKCGYNGTDDTVLMEMRGIKTKIIYGSYYNIKITTDEDLTIAAAINRVI